MHRARRFLFLTILGLAAFFLLLGGPDIVTSHEARVVQPARVMAASGWPWSAKTVEVPQVHVVRSDGALRLAPDPNLPPMAVNPWLIPVLNGNIRLQKPPLPYWCAAILFHFFGFSEWSVRLVPALLGLLATFVAFDLGQTLYGRPVGYCAALVWVSTYAVTDMYRKAMADPYLGFFTLVCVWAWIRACHSKESVKRKSGLWILLFYLSIGFALLAKGPPAFVTVLIPLAAYHICFRKALPGPWTIHYVGIALMLLIALPWPAYVMRHIPHAIDQWRYESVGELADNTENARPWFFYIEQLPYLPLPWTLIWLVGCIIPFVRRLGAAGLSFPPPVHRGRVKEGVYSTSSGQAFSQLAIDQPPPPQPSPGVPGAGEKSPPRRSNEPGVAARSALSSGRRWFAISWWGASVLFFSLVHLKKNQYLLPAIPAQTFMIAIALAQIIRWARRAALKGQPAALLAIQTFIGIGFMIGVGVMVVIDHRPMMALAALPGVVFALFPLWALRRQNARIWIGLQTAVYVAAILLFWGLYFHPEEDRRSPKPVAAELLALSRQPGYTLLVPRLPEEVSIYLPLNVHYGYENHILTIMDDTHGVHQRHGKPIPPPQVTTFQRMVPDAEVTAVRRVPMKSAPGDARWKVYDITVRRTGFAMR